MYKTFIPFTLYGPHEKTFAGTTNVVGTIMVVFWHVGSLTNSTIHFLDFIILRTFYLVLSKVIVYFIGHLFDFKTKP